MTHSATAARNGRPNDQAVKTVPHDLPQSAGEAALEDVWKIERLAKSIALSGRDLKCCQDASRIRGSVDSLRGRVLQLQGGLYDLLNEDSRFSDTTLMEDKEEFEASIRDAIRQQIMVLPESRDRESLSSSRAPDPPEGGYDLVQNRVSVAAGEGLIPFRGSVSVSCPCGSGDLLEFCYERIAIAENGRIVTYRITFAG